ncbi:acyl-CoA dehydrogenase [Weissella oryzae SG25]|uniref:Acyl-CoA dehydrogenase n=1 Tax=Weissella oryzae (strain DSM 25784 / JCM 18191 / LMG 30913 / SG25) TaxID=1329250 RepID=A0A069D1K4_WEIOS|nr:hypothetical protein [Weissella oryzae]GAK31231.1 acyl-CoA dehydrogenase [Weissella oryzae SG25]
MQKRHKDIQLIEYYQSQNLINKNLSSYNVKQSKLAGHSKSFLGLALLIILLGLGLIKQLVF